ncbi:MAG: glycosyltransferase [Planctomycetaceae bacterium]|nr:glycosyltransferase [Planctomycetaceae bacterium]
MNLLGMFARRPVPGFCKTRLAGSLGDETAAALSHCFVNDLVRRFRLLLDDSASDNAIHRFVVAVASETVSGPQALNDDWLLKAGLSMAQIRRQPRVSFADRLQWFFDDSQAIGATRCVLTGSDSPDLPLLLIRQAFSLLNQHDFVIAPASDGGFVLVGSSVPVGPVFQNVRLGTSDACEDLLAELARAGHSVAVTGLWHDVDTVDDLRALAQRLNAGLDGAGQGGDVDCPETLSLLRKLSLL